MPKTIPWSRAFDDHIEKPHDKTKGYVRDLPAVSSLIKGPITLALPDHVDFFTLGYVVRDGDGLETFNWFIPPYVIYQQKQALDMWDRVFPIMRVTVFTRQLTNNHLLRLLQEIGYSDRIINYSVVHKPLPLSCLYARNERESRQWRQDLISEWWRRSWRKYCGTCKQWSEACTRKNVIMPLCANPPSSTCVPS
jgi:hypothetical protein